MNPHTTALCLRDIDALFQPFLHRKLNLFSRLVMAPMARHQSFYGEPTPDMLSYYRQRAEHKVGLIITEPVSVNDASAAGKGMTLLYGGSALREWKRICRAVHATFCKIAPQLSHAGMLRDGADAIGPSGIDPHTMEQRGDTMSRTRIKTVVSAFAETAAAARLLGFDAVEINGANGGLIEQFMRKETNHRHDEYGGDSSARTRFACEVLHAVRKTVGRRYPVIFRMPQLHASSLHEQPLAENPAELSSILDPLCEAGVDVFACESPVESTPLFPGSPLSAAGWIRLLTHRPVIIGGGITGNPHQLNQLIRRLNAREFDLISVGRALQADAEWGSKVFLAQEETIQGLAE